MNKFVLKYRLYSFFNFILYYHGVYLTFTNKFTNLPGTAFHVD